MSQVGHADLKMTTDVYAQLRQRAKRDHGAKFDKLVRDAREQLLAPTEAVREAPIVTSVGRKVENALLSAPAGVQRLELNPATCRPFVSGRSRIRTWDLFLIREAL